jgi:protoporphyrinogen oxidase
MKRASRVEIHDVVVLGAGVAGLAAATTLGEHAVVVEKDERPGGLVRTDFRDGYWFDRVLHLLHFRDPVTEERIHALLGADLARCVPVAWVECPAGTVRFPFQTNLGGLDEDVAVRCVEDFARVSFAGVENDAPAANFEEYLLRSFGRSMFDVFFGPYNRKMWKRPLRSLAPSGFTWNITRPDFAQVLRGFAAADSQTGSYNENGWYPRPSPISSVRGMEVLARSLAAEVHDLRLEHRVEELDLASRTIRVTRRGRMQALRFREACVCTLPLPVAVSMCPQAPDDLRRALRKLTRNRVWTVMISVRGPRPEGRGHWRYYTDESLVFNRLVHMHEFDPDSAPPDGWGLMAEITEPAEAPLPDRDELVRRTLRDVERVVALPAGCRVVDSEAVLVDPAYVVFSVDNREIVERARRFLLEGGIRTVGRYGNWEYSSMAGVMRDGFTLGEEIGAAVAVPTPSPVEAPRAV